MELELAGKRALITGGSRGIGFACATALASEGADLALAARTVGPLKEATRELRDSYPIEVTSHSCDLARTDHQRALTEVVGPIDVVVNCAGTIPTGNLDAVDDARWRQAWDVKVLGTINLCRLVLPMMVARGSGVIVNVFGSVPADDAEQVAGASGAAALDAVTRSLGTSSRAGGVRVVGVGVPSGSGAVEADVEALSDVVLFLCSERAALLSGTVVTINT